MSFGSVHGSITKTRLVGPLGGSSHVSLHVQHVVHVADFLAVQRLHDSFASLVAESLPGRAEPLLGKLLDDPQLFGSRRGLGVSRRGVRRSRKLHLRSLKLLGQVFRNLGSKESRDGLEHLHPHFRIGVLQMSQDVVHALLLRQLGHSLWQSSRLCSDVGAVPVGQSVGVEPHRL